MTHLYSTRTHFAFCSYLLAEISFGTRDISVMPFLVEISVEAVLVIGISVADIPVVGFSVEFILSVGVLVAEIPVEEIAAVGILVVIVAVVMFSTSTEIYIKTLVYECHKLSI